MRGWGRYRHCNRIGPENALAAAMRRNGSAAIAANCHDQSGKSRGGERLRVIAESTDVVRVCDRDARLPVVMADFDCELGRKSSRYLAKPAPAVDRGVRVPPSCNHRTSGRLQRVVAHSLEITPDAHDAMRFMAAKISGHE